jgi:hypothetical protein
MCVCVCVCVCVCAYVRVCVQATEVYIVCMESKRGMKGEPWCMAALPAQRKSISVRAMEKTGHALANLSRDLQSKGWKAGGIDMQPPTITFQPKSDGLCVILARALRRNRQAISLASPSADGPRRPVTATAGGFVSSADG